MRYGVVISFGRSVVNGVGVGLMWLHIIRIIIFRWMFSGFVIAVTIDTLPLGVGV